MIIDPLLGYFTIGCCYALAVIHMTWPWIDAHIRKVPLQGQKYALFSAMLVGIGILACGWPYFLAKDLWTWCRRRWALYRFHRWTDKHIDRPSDPPDSPST